MEAAERLVVERNIWLTTLRADGSPHVTPVWFVYLDAAFWACTTSTSVKARNVAVDPRVSLALEDGDRPVVAEGRVRLHGRPYPDAVVSAFGRKFGWDITTPGDDGDYGALLEISVDRWLLGGPT